MLDARAWLLWALAVLVTATSTRNPLYAVLVLLIVAVVELAYAPRRRAGTSATLRFGCVAIPLTVLFNGLIAHAGETVLFRFPAWIPLLGGPVTLEALAYGAINGLTLTAIFGGFSTFNQATPARDLIRLTPRAFHEAGVVLSVTLTLVPQMKHSLERIREAQAVRGHRIRGLRDWLPIFLPLLVSGLERALGLAKAMVARGYGAIADRAHALRTQGLLALGLTTLLLGWLAYLFWPQGRVAATCGMVAGAGIIAGLLWWAGRSTPHTTYREHPWNARESLVVLGCGVALAVLLLPLPLVSRETLSYSPYPHLALPQFDPGVGLGILGLLVPALAVGERISAGEERTQTKENSPRSTPRRAKPTRTQSHYQISAISAPSAVKQDPSCARPAAMIDIEQLTYSYPEASAPVLDGLTLHVAPAAFVLVAGPSGAGKSTLLRCLNGLVPHFAGGSIAGHISVAGHDPIREGPHVLSRVVGFVFQDPQAQFVLDSVEDEIAFGLENAGVPRADMRARVEDVLRMLDLLPLRARKLATLSGGEQQRVAIAAALAFRPRVLVLDEPTSQLDPLSAADVLQSLVRLNRELELTVVLAEHRLERVLPHVDHLIYLPGDPGSALDGPPRQVLPHMTMVPPLVTVGKALGWHPLPLTLQEGRSFATQTPLPPAAARPEPPAAGKPRLVVRDLHAAYNAGEVLRGIEFQIAPGELVALMGRNGSGKTTLLKCITGLLSLKRGDILLDGRSIAGQDSVEICRHVGYLPQEPDAMLFADTVLDELHVTLRNHGLLNAPPVAPPDLLARLGLGDAAATYPRDLSVGQRQRVALGAVTVTRPGLLLLDEPTRGLDYQLKQQLAALLHEWQAQGTSILLVTHDVEWVAQAADRIVMLDQGEVLADDTPEALAASSLFVPQMAGLFPGRGWLTAEGVLGARRDPPA